MGNFITSNPNIRRATGALVAAAAIYSGAIACSNPEQPTAALCPTATEHNIPSVNQYMDSAERNNCLNLVVQDASQKLLKAFEANPDNFTVSNSYFTVSRGITDENKNNFVNIDPKPKADANPDAPTLSMYAFLGSDGKFDLSKRYCSICCS